MVLLCVPFRRHLRQSHVRQEELCIMYSALKYSYITVTKVVWIICTTISKYLTVLTYYVLLLQWCWQYRWARRLDYFVGLEDFLSGFVIQYFYLWMDLTIRLISKSLIFYFNKHASHVHSLTFETNFMQLYSLMSACNDSSLI